MPSLPPETITMHSLALFQQLCNLARFSVIQDVDVEMSDASGSSSTSGGSASMDYLWKIALFAFNTDVSMTAIQYLNNYYIGRQLEKEEEFVQRCMSHLNESTQELVQLASNPVRAQSPAAALDEAPLLRIQRALLLLKSHLEIFRRRFAYHLRKWSLEGKGIGSHAQLVGDKGAVTIRILIQPAGYHDKVTLEMSSSDYVADLRAEVSKWWETIQVKYVHNNSKFEFVSTLV
jgi:ubiquitin carboxyl-terminal hydrolase 34